MATLKFYLVLLSFFFIVNSFAQGVSVNATGAQPHSSAILDVSSTTQGFVMPRMTASERNGISTPTLGLMIFNTDCENIDIYLSSGWQPLNQSGLAPSVPLAAVNIFSDNQVTWKWRTVNGATGYKYNTVNDYASATSNGTDTTFTQTGLSCSTAYTFYVWAYNSCGNSAVSALTQTTGVCFICGSSSVSFTYSGTSVTYGTVSGTNGTCWLDRNLGASHVATAYNDASGYGDLFEWGRLDDGHQARSSSLSYTTSGTDVPGNANYISNQSSPYDWRSPQNGSLWQGVSGTNNPCPAGWRLPTEAEMNSERATWGAQSYSGAFANALKWTAAGLRSFYWGTLSYEGTVGYYWVSNVSGTNARSIELTSSSAQMQDGQRAAGMSVRCVRN